MLTGRYAGGLGVPEDHDGRLVRCLERRHWEQHQRQAVEEVLKQNCMRWEAVRGRRARKETGVESSRSRLPGGVAVVDADRSSP